MVAPTPHRFQWGMLGYVGLIWFADAMELMMLSFIGPAVSYGCTPTDTRFIPSACYVMYRSCGMSPPTPALHP